MAVSHTAAVRTGISDFVVDQLDEGTPPGKLVFQTAGSVAVATSTFSFIRDRSRHPRASREARVSLAPSIIPTQRFYQLGVAGTARF